MPKLYVARMLILDPNSFCSVNNTLSGFTSSEVLVRRVPFGYQEVLTKHFFLKGKKLGENSGYNFERYPHTVCDSITVDCLMAGHMQFVLDDRFSFPLRQAEEKDAEDYVNRFETSPLAVFYAEQERKIKEAKEEKVRIKNSRRRARQIIKEWNNTNK